jgi:hypothetical protein
MISTDVLASQASLAASLLSEFEVAAPEEVEVIETLTPYEKQLQAKKVKRSMLDNPGKLYRRESLLYYRYSLRFEHDHWNRRSRRRRKAISCNEGYRRICV